MIETDQDVRDLVESFGELLEFSGHPIWAIWGDPYVEVPSGESSVASADSSATVSKADAELISKGATVVRRDVGFRVALKEPDGTDGTVRLTLERIVT